MHFWIDKRSQACIYSGRNRIAASLGTNGNNFGLSQPRRIPRVTKSMVTPIHRFPTVECTRQHNYRQQQQPQHSPSNISQHSSSHSHQSQFSFGPSTNQLHQSSAYNNSNQAHHNNHRVYKYSSSNLINFFC